LKNSKKNLKKLEKKLEKMQKIFLKIKGIISNFYSNYFEFSGILFPNLILKNSNEIVKMTKKKILKTPQNYLLIA
jgi:hypothetical protein